MVNIETGEITDIITKDDAGNLQVAKAAIEGMRNIEITKKQLDDEYSKYRQELQGAMEKYGIEKIDTDSIGVTYIGAHEQTRVDSKSLKALYPEIFDACTKTSNVKACVKVRIK